MSTKNIKENIKILKEYVKIYKSLEKYFGTDNNGDIVYNKDLDNKMAIENIESKSPYTNYKSFLKLVNGKSRRDIEKNIEKLNNELNIMEKPKIDKVDKILKPSSEQKSIIESIKQNTNILVDAVAGSGKTTTVMFVAKDNSKKKILQITYNKQLKLEVRNKIQNSDIDNLEIHTYHSLTVKYYDKNAHTDDNIIKVITNNVKPKMTKKYDILIIDEVQDMTPNYFSLVCKFIHDMEMDPTLLILGDRKQGIYEFKNADTRFLEYSNKIWNDKNNFVILPLQQSYRVTKQIAWFVNNVMLGEERVISNKESKHPVYYYKRNKFSISNVFADKVVEFIKAGYSPSDIFVLSPSVKSSNKSPLKALENKLVEKKIPVYFARNEEDGIDEEIIKGKVVFTTFHQSKGRERKIVFVFGFDETYFDFHCKEKPRNECPSELYVAITRASEILVILEHESDKSLSFMKYKENQLRAFPQMINYNGKFEQVRQVVKQTKKTKDMHKTSVTELTKFLGEEMMNKLIPLLEKITKVITKPCDKYSVDIPSNVKMNNGLTEDVSDLNGLIIPAMYEASTTESNISALQMIIKDMCDEATGENKKFIDKITPKLQKYFESSDKISAYLCMGNLYIALNEQIHSKITQIDKYNWITPEMVKICHKNLSKNVQDTAVYEQEIGDMQDAISKYFDYKTNLYGTIQIRGRVDAYDDTTLWEFKCVSNIQMEHLLQLIVYAWIWEKSMKDLYGKKLFKILNIRTGEVREIIYESFVIDQIVNILFENKYHKKEKDNNEDFIKKCKIARDKIYEGKVTKNILNFVTEKKEEKHNSDASDSEGDYAMSMFTKKL